jgi:glutamine amidotransferase
MQVVIIKYNAGNIFSVDYGLKRIGVEAQITGDINKIKNADKIIFPGVGEAETTMAYLREHGLDKVIKELTQPVLGICIGMQLLCSYSEEGNTDCLGIFDEKVMKFSPPDLLASTSLSDQDIFKVPHMGWNTIQHTDNKLFNGISQDDYVYYVHSYFAGIGKDTIATTDYIQPYSAALQKDNFYAVQFHPEKSGKVGEKILKNFMEL